jgi:carboxylesterase type B
MSVTINMSSYHLVVGLAALLLGLFRGAVSQTVTVANGTIQGSKCPNNNVNSFLGIPYAKAPIGDLRFAAPQPYDSTYNGTLQATKPAPNCPQFGSSFIELGPSSEDW